MSRSPEAMAATMVANLKENTGKSLAQWLQVVADVDKELVGWIRQAYDAS